VLIKALDLLVNRGRRTDIQLHIVGDGDEVYMKELKRMIQRMRLARTVLLHGKVGHDGLLAYYDRADILLVPSLWQEPFGLVVVEAMARGLPVIASDEGGPAEIVTHGKDGILVKPGDERALASAITDLLGHEDWRVRLAINARATVARRFTLEENINRVEQHLLKTLAHRPGMIQYAQDELMGPSR
jgi:glycosyltransferase involved in cell wall biosynthesis